MSQARDIAIEFTSLVAPVQAEGRVAGHPFYFRARFSAWTFAIALIDALDPVDIDATTAAATGFFRAGKVAGAYGASYMARADAEAIIRALASEFLDQSPR